MGPEPPFDNYNNIELNMFSKNKSNRNGEYINLNTTDDGDDDDYSYKVEENLLINENNTLNDTDSLDSLKFNYRGILKYPWKISKRQKKRNRRKRNKKNSSISDDMNERLISDDDSMFNTEDEDMDEEEEDSEEEEANEILSNNDYYLRTQDEIPFTNILTSFSKTFITNILYTSRYNTYQKQTRKRCMISLLTVYTMAFIYLLIALYIDFQDGYTTSDIHDINGYTSNSMVFSALTLLFTTSIGMISLRYKFKPALTLYIILNVISFSFHFYSVKQIHESIENSERNIAFAWWDVYTDDIKIKFENKYNCCGYLNYMDNAIPTDHCPEEFVHRKVKPETLGPIPVVKQKNKFNKTYTIPDLKNYTQRLNIRDQIYYQMSIVDIDKMGILESSFSNEINDKINKYSNNKVKPTDPENDIKIKSNIKIIPSQTSKLASSNSSLKLKSNSSSSSTKLIKKAKRNINIVTEGNSKNNNQIEYLIEKEQKLNKPSTLDNKKKKIKEKVNKNDIKIEMKEKAIKNKDKMKGVKGCSEKLKNEIEGSLSILCIFCWILTLGSPLALIFSVLYWRTLDITPKSYEYF